ncbi:11773_t:CDS:2, partial [Rhizophagus irregularis]
FFDFPSFHPSVVWEEFIWLRNKFSSGLHTSFAYIGGISLDLSNFFSQAGVSPDQETTEHHKILEKNTLTKIAKLEKQLKLLKEQTSKDNKKQNSEKQKTFEAVEQSDEKPKQSSIKEICKHKINCKKNNYT